jgi:hypothetical protein
MADVNGELVDYHDVQYTDGANAERAVGNDDSHNLE